jgi:hypothetical protein
MKTSSILALGALASLTLSCKVQFDESTRYRLESSDNLAIEQVQFYNDKPIQLLYKSTSKNDAVKSGKVKFNNGFYYYYINIPKNTKAIAKSPNKKELRIFFEEEQKGFLTFRVKTQENSELYLLNSAKTDTGFFVTYDGKQMQVTNGEQALLKIKKSQKNITDKKRRRVKGLKVVR